ncbi:MULTISPECIES: SLAC1 anion channel family protein [unclassified Herbaspirillum]|uniref:SLAC1 anion channel family protein n=1 Tax=unclassified Herbaspirillum TaxID=2624150 RepID=UPI000E2E47AB|nr:MULTISPECIES: SLAC1 anion channel family protein [unclassified Herbaspirillum]RFB70898.1 C4-dicarboxylate ABC transporter [Herbaspirillum sp. 3R-3a1]TFI08579.1 C4-dicarboxylate ABC transporter [Herbaspirillum sp. 3R11]TFI14993.1 C4-dicarboxylate ABC transporter [Herbaspirillum sp. 3R-11]TFI25162.1 C4-dicarboxylate ABC transporter [Herbaspirillum sp. 3C11]
METASTSRAAIPAARTQSVRHMPIGLFGSVMSIAGLALAWRLASKAYGVTIAVSDTIGVVALALFAVLVLSYLGKLVLHPEIVKAEFAHPVSGSFFGTVGISIMLLSSVIGSYSSSAQLVVWCIGTVITLALSVLMISRLLNGNAAPASAVPAWLIGGVGSLDIVVTGGSFTTSWTHEVNLLGAAIGSVSAIVFFILIFSRLIHHDPLSAAMRPSKMILMAPFAVGFIAYVNLAQKVDMFAALLFYFGLFLFAIILYRLLVKPAPFSSTWWGIGFPMAAMTNAAFIYAGAVGGKGLGLIAAFLLFVLTTSIIVLSFRTLHALLTGRLLSA